tara:strand:+ start:4207 stop:5061 length:855 start_codon:yes stop_codon:yes gene_type:complete
METIEDIILDHDRRGISLLREHLPIEFCGQAAEILSKNSGTVFIVTGFYILAAEATETDGPPGAVVIGEALSKLDYKVVYISDLYTSPLIRSVVGNTAEVIDFPIFSNEESNEFANELLEKYQPSVIVGIERCGFTDEYKFRNMHGKDISDYNAKTDYLFTNHQNTLAIGDGGNEIGMGNCDQIIANDPQILIKKPCITKVNELIIASTSNWGGYGLIAALSEKKNINLLPSIQREIEILDGFVEAGAVDGVSQKRVSNVDGFSKEENSAILQRLHHYLKSIGI